MTRATDLDTPTLCMRRYERSDRMKKAGLKLTYQDLWCQFPKQHPAGCSWQQMFDLDTDAITKTMVGQSDTIDKTTALAVEIIDAIEDGDLDAYLEAILAAGHNRKRCLRGERMFGTLRSRRE